MAIGRQRRTDQPNWLRDPLYTRARSMPSLDLDFAGTQSLIDRISGQSLVTFTRASNSTRINAAGALETLGNDVPRITFDAATGRCLGLLVEESRTNLLLNSATLSTQSVTVAATAHTLSFTGTGTVTLSGTSTAGPLVGTGTGEANRVALTFTPTAGTLTVTVSGTVSNAQLEAGAFRTSWIPTTGTSANRAADIATITGANFSLWHNNDRGTFFVRAAIAGPNATSAGTAFPNGILKTTDGTTNNNLARVVTFGTNNSPNRFVAAHRDGSASRSASDSSYDNPITPRKQYAMAAAFVNAGGCALSVDGRTVIVDEFAVTPAAPTRMLIGTGNNGAISGVGNDSTYLNGPIARLIYFPRRLPDHVLQELPR